MRDAIYEIVESSFSLPNEEAKKVMTEYYLKFGDFPPLPYSKDYGDDAVINAMKSALKTGEVITLDSYPENDGEGVIMGFTSED